MRWIGIGLVLWGCGVEGPEVPDAYELLTPREQLIRLVGHRGTDSRRIIGEFPSYEYLYS